MKSISKIFMGLVFTLFTASIFASSVGVPIAPVAGGAIVVNTITSFLPQEAGTLNEVAKNELAERELIKHFRHVGSWFMQIPSKNKWVNNDVIKLTEIGGDPNVLIDNNTYPIPVASRADDTVAISLHKYTTENTQVTEDEAYALPYDKEGSVQQQHRETLEEKTAEHALHSFAPTGNTTDTPVIETTGPDDGTGRKRMIPEDIINYDKTLNKLKVPKKGRMLILSAEHKADLMIADLTLKNLFQNHKTGDPAPMQWGFEVYDDIYSPVYNGVDKTKTAFGADDPADARGASVVILKSRAAKAVGSAVRYFRAKKDDPENRKSVVGFDLYFLAIPLKTIGFGAIIDGKVKSTT